MTNYNKFILGLLIVVITNAVNAGGGSDNKCPPAAKGKDCLDNQAISCVTPCSSAPAVACCPTIDKKVSLDPQNTTEVIGVTALTAIENARRSMETSIDAARHSMEESKEFYERFAYILTAIILAAGVAGFTHLKSYVAEITEKKAADSLKGTNAEIEKLKTELKDHLDGRNQFRKKMEEFQKETLSNLEAFLSITTELNKFTIWIIDHGRKPPSERPPADSVVNPILKVCEEVLALKPTNKTLLGIVFGTKGIALHLSSKYDAAYKSFLKSLSYRNDKAGTLFNIACSACQLGRYKEAKHYLARAIALEPERAQHALSDHDFEPIWDDKEFKVIVGEKT